MLLWIALACLTAAVMAFVLAPLSQRRTEGEAGGNAADIAVYRDQLKEIDADHERGLIGDDEAESARTEVSRRLLQQAGAGPAGADAPGATGQPADISTKILYSAGTAVPALALGLYLFAGSPGMPGQPFAERAQAPNSSAGIDVLIARVEKQLRDNPADGQGWDVLAPVYLKQQKYAQAADAYARAIDLLGETPQRLAGFGEAKVIANNGIVPEEARRAFSRLLVKEPKRADARFWLALAKEQDGKLADAAADYRALLKDSPANAPWRPAVTQQLQGIEIKLAGGPAAVTAGAGAGRGSGAANAPASGGSEERGPTAADIAAAKSMSEGDRSQMINQMVEGLATRLKSNGDDLKGWQKLMRAYVVLGRKKDAVAALADARRQFAKDEKALAALDDLAKSLQLGS